LDPDEFDWDDLGLCRGTVTAPSDDVFFDKYESDEESARSADEMCLRCPVIRQCFFEGAKGKTGVWGGVYWNGSGKPDKNKNNHKSDDTWARIHQRVSANNDED
jgi:hypothetical protein